MSWFYEALLRAEKERPPSADGTRTTIIRQDGELRLPMVELSPSTVARQVGLKAETRAPDGSSAVENTPTESALSSQGLRRPIHPLSNGLRHVTLQRREESRLVIQTDPRGLPAEQFRLLRRNLRQEFPSTTVLMITSPGQGDGKTLTSLNLAACLASFGDKTLLVEGDVRQPTIGRIFGRVIESPGIEDAWADKVEPHRTVHVIDELSLHAALVAKVPDAPSQLVNASGVNRFLAWAREYFRWVVVDAPPVLPAADVAELVPLVDAALLVIRARSTSRELTKRAFEMLGTHLHGVIFNAAIVDSTVSPNYLVPIGQGGGAKRSNSLLVR